MDDLVQFLRNRLDEDERTAIAATQGDWVWSREFVTPPGYHHRTIGPLEPGDAAHIVRHDPARVLREVEAKRRILDEFVAALDEEDKSWEAKYATYGVEDGRWVKEPLDTSAPLLRLLALPYADHPDYREDWRP